MNFFNIKETFTNKILKKKFLKTQGINIKLTEKQMIVNV